MTHAKKPPFPPARRIALGTLQRVLDHRVDIQAELDARLREPGLDPRDKALATELCYGYLRLKGRIDFFLGRFLRDAAKLAPGVRLILGVATHELLYLDKVPDYATLDWAVNRTKKKFSPGLGKLVNGVLRNVAREREAAFDRATYASQGNPVQTLSRWFATPEWIVRLWLDAYGEQQTERLLATSILPAPLGVRLNPAHPQADETRAFLTSLPGHLTHQGDAFRLQRSALADIEPHLDQGTLSRQSVAAQNALLALRPDTWPEPIWDACAGRGGKTLLLHERGLKVAASDVSEKRISQIPDECVRLGLPPLPTALSSATEPPAFAEPEFSHPQTFLLDAPCSGLGVLSRRPDAKWRRTPKDMADLATLQGTMLASASEVLKPGGKIAYMTCTLTPEENELQIERFLAAHPFDLDFQGATEPDSGDNECFWWALLTKR